MNGMRVVENVTFRENAGAAGMLDLYLPEGKECSALLIYFHGGGIEGGDKADNRNVYLELAKANIAVASANYRMYPEAKFPDFVEDAARCVAWCFSHVKEYISFGQVFVGGISAGAYLSMMLHFEPRFLAECGAREEDVTGYIFDAGQPTVHYNILRERGMDTRAVRVDEAAPLYYLEKDRPVNASQRYLFLISDHDIVGRKEQNELLMRTMEAYHYERSRIDYRIICGYGHTEYVGVTDEAGKSPYAALLLDFISGKKSEVKF